MTYKIEILSKPRRQIKALPKDIQNLVRVKIRSLAENPRPPGVKKLSGVSNLLGHRKEIYRS